MPQKIKTAQRLLNDYRHHAPRNQKDIEKHEKIRAHCHDLAATLNEICPDSRELSIVFTKLEEAMFWANAAIARNRE